MSHSPHSLSADDRARHTLRLLQLIAGLLLIVTAMKLLGVFGPRPFVSPDYNYVGTDVMVTGFVVLVAAGLRGWRWLVWIALAFILLFCPLTWEHVPPRFWQPLDIAAAAVFVLGALAWVIRLKLDGRQP